MHESRAAASPLRTFARVDIYRAENGEWGSRLNAESTTRISTSVDRSRFFELLTAA